MREKIIISKNANDQEFRPVICMRTKTVLQDRIGVCYFDILTSQ